MTCSSVSQACPDVLQATRLGAMDDISMRHDNRSGHFFQDRSACAPQHRLPQPGMPVPAHHDEIRLNVGRSWARPIGSLAHPIHAAQSPAAMADLPRDHLVHQCHTAVRKPRARTVVFS